MFQINWPVCVCGACAEWSPFEVRGRYREIFLQTWKCNICGRPACFIEDDGGNAFVVPRADTEIFPPDVRDYIIRLHAKFIENGIHIDMLRRQYEQNRYLEICIHNDVCPGDELRDYSEQVRLNVLTKLGCIVCEDGWERPHGLTTYPIPPYWPTACTHFIAPGVPPYDPGREYWYIIGQKTNL